MVGLDAKKVALAYSGGLDSRFLALTLRRQGADILLLNAVGPHIAPDDTEYALTWARENALPCLTFPFDPLGLPGMDTRERCYVCKKRLFRTIKALLCERNESDRVLCDGTNRDDHSIFRPGLAAVREEHVLSPLDMAGLGKAEIRRMARECGLENPDQKARPCLLTRLAYGMKSEASVLARIASVESSLERALADCPGPLPDIRLRLTPTPLLQLGAMPDLFLPKVREILEKAAFLPSRLLVGGTVSGFFDRQEFSGEKDIMLYP